MTLERILVLSAVLLLSGCGCEEPDAPSAEALTPSAPAAALPSPHAEGAQASPALAPTPELAPAPELEAARPSEDPGAAPAPAAPRDKPTRGDERPRLASPPAPRRIEGFGARPPSSPDDRGSGLEPSSERARASSGGVVPAPRRRVLGPATRGQGLEEGSGARAR